MGALVIKVIIVARDVLIAEGENSVSAVDNLLCGLIFIRYFGEEIDMNDLSKMLPKPVSRR